MKNADLDKTTRLLPLNIQLFAESEQSDESSDNEADKDKEDGKEEGSKDEDKKEPEKKYTDDDVNNISKKNSDKAVKKLMKDLGIDDVEEAKEILANARAEKEKNKSAEDKANELSTSLSNKDKILSQKTSQLATALLENRLMREGVDPNKIERAAKMIPTASVLNDDGDVDDELMKTEITSLLNDFPEFKKKSEEDNSKTFKFGSDGKQDSGKAKEEFIPKKGWNRFNH